MVKTLIILCKRSYPHLQQKRELTGKLEETLCDLFDACSRPADDLAGEALTSGTL